MTTKRGGDGPITPMPTEFDAALDIERMTLWLRTVLESAEKSCYVLGLSGGVDSAVVAYLAVRAVGPRRVRLLRLPYGIVGPSRFLPSTMESLDDAAAVAEGLPGANLATVNIAPAVDAMAESLGLAAELEAKPDDEVLRISLGNLKARARMLALYATANRYNGLVLGTENRTEHYTGFFTRHGDEASDVEVLPGYFKGEVRALAAALGVPSSVRTKAPTADLWKGQTDEGELGFSYDDADAVLRAAVAFDDPVGPEARRDAPKMSGVPAATVHRILDRVAATAFKRAAKPTFPRSPLREESS